MANIDQQVADLLDREATITTNNHRSTAADHSDDGDDDEDRLIAMLEDGEEQHLSAFRERRLEQLHAEFARAKLMRESDHGRLTELTDEKQLMDLTAATKLCVVHFFKPDFGRCAVMDRHLEALAAKHFDTRFLKIHVDHAPFLVAKLRIQVLPCVHAFVDGRGVDRLLGFEGIAPVGSPDPDRFATRDLEARLLRSGVLVRPKFRDDDEEGDVLGGRKAQKVVEEEEEDDDWD